MRHTIDFFTIEEHDNHLFTYVDTNIIYGELTEVVSRFSNIKDFVKKTFPHVNDVKIVVTGDSYGTYVDAEIIYANESTQ